MTLGFVRLLERSADATAAAMVLRFCAFQNHVFLFMMMLYGKDAMKFLTNWSLFFHVQYFALPRDRPALDGVARVVHAVGFWAAYAVFFGFLSCAACGGAVPADVLLKARTEPATQLGISSFIGWIHGGPTTVYVLDAVLSRDYLRRLYRGGRGGTWLAVGGAIYFAVGTFWECVHPNTMEIYSAPQPLWRDRGRRFARFLGVTGSAEDLRLRRNALGIGEDVAFSQVVKYGGMVGAAAAAAILNALVLRDDAAAGKAA